MLSIMQLLDLYVIVVLTVRSFCELPIVMLTWLHD